MPTFPDVRVADPTRHETLTVFPLFAQTGSDLSYLLCDEAISAGSVTVEEVSESGSVPTLLVDNRTDSPVLFLEGEELRGAKQNRVLNTSLLVAANSKTTIPVSCVEQGRWRHLSRHFVSGSHSSSKLRHILKKTVSRSARAGHGHASDQGEVWKEVGRQMESLGSHSDTGAMADTYDSFQGRLTEFRERLKYPEGATGLAVAVGDKLVSVDLFDKPSTCRKVWDRLLDGVVLDALEAGAGETSADAGQVQTMLAELRDASWQQAPPIGVGEDYRADLKGDRHASVLVRDETVVHGSLVSG
ncbi:MAG TPA: DUF6569 family protein [Gemmataceae bacterium]|nr:DUF6569 family protein [Gemmataceae bacterium]